tara:strand:- start:345 stop:1109 length:765 start_codon:yes stop_codon:yes gene_type:complete
MKGIKGDRWRYKPKQNKIFPISRTKFGNFLDCQRCFYLDVVEGLKSPSMPGWALNSATDEMLKNEFDIHRKNQTQHPDMIGIKSLQNVVPYQHKDLNQWRENFQGFKYIHNDLNLELKGAIDDVWIDKKTNELIIVDYKSTAKNDLDEKKWINDKYTRDYLKQMNFYTYLFKKAGFPIKTTFFYIVNALKKNRTFNNNMKFQSILIEYQPDTKDIEKQLKEMKKLMDNDQTPPPTEECEDCLYLDTGYNLINNE